MRNILIAAAVMGGMGLISGILLGVAGRLFDVKADPVERDVRALLPGANCGACGYASCDAYSAAVAGGAADVNRCPVGGDAVRRSIGERMGAAEGIVKK